MTTRSKLKKTSKPVKQLLDKLSPSAKKKIKENIVNTIDLPKDKNKGELGAGLSKSGAILLLIGLMLLSGISLLTVNTADGVKAYYAPLLI